MNNRDKILFTRQAVTSNRMRSILTSLGIAIGVTAVVLLTSMGEGLNQYIVSQFSQMGTNNLRIGLGKSETIGLSPGMLNTQRPLTVEDGVAVSQLPGVVASVPGHMGLAEVEANGRLRNTNIYGGSPEIQHMLQVEVREGTFLPDDDPSSPRALAVLGSTIHQQLYDKDSAVGEPIRIGGSRFRVVGVLEEKGDVLGMNVDESVILPAARSLALFNTESLFEIGVRYEADMPVDELIGSIRRLMIARHGVEDFNIESQQQMMEALNEVLDVLTAAVAALGSISLVVGGVGIFTIMTIAVRERTAEIGLLRSIGSNRRVILQLFLFEAAVLAGTGGLLGLAIGGGIILLLEFTMPSLPMYPSMPYIVAALLVSIAIGLIAGVVPANRAAHLDPLDALRTE